MLAEIIQSVPLDQLLKIFIAAVLGMIIGFEREYSGKPAGLRTYMLVCMGSALFTILSFAGLENVPHVFNYDPSRIASQIVVGVGFLGAGIIFFTKTEIHGLTSAASVWAAAAIGMAVGMGFYFSCKIGRKNFKRGKRRSTIVKIPQKRQYNKRLSSILTYKPC